jgi:hypothetical protein
LFIFGVLVFLSWFFQLVSVIRRAQLPVFVIAENFPAHQLLFEHRFLMRAHDVVLGLWEAALGGTRPI